MEALASAGTVLTIIHLSAKVTRLGCEYIKGVKGAQGEILALMHELSALSTILLQLHKWITANPGLSELEELIKPDGLLSGCLERLGSQLKELDPKSGHKNWFKRAAIRFVWPLTEMETSQYVTRLETQKSSLLLALAQSHTSCLATIQKDILSMNRHVLNMEAHVESMVTHVIGTSLAVQDIHTIIVDQGATKKRDAVLEWLYAEPLGEKHKTIVEMRQEGTGQWLLRRPEFQEWVGGRLPSRLLWGYGIPGAGKTFLSSIVIDHLRDQVPGAKVGVAHIYFEYHEKDNQSPLGVMSSLVRQLLDQIPKLPTDIECLYDALKAGGSRPTLENLFTALIMTRDSFSGVFLILDALDEIKFDHDQWRDTFLSLFQRMGDCGINLFMTSRPHPEDIKKALVDAGKIELVAPDEDLELYIRRIYKNSRAARFIKEGNCEKRITPELLKCCNGMFLLVRFHIEYLNQQTTTRRFLSALDNLKNSSSSGGSPLEKTYDRAMESIRNQRDPAKLAFKVFWWLVRANRTLSIEEIRIAVSVEQGRQELDKLDIPDRITLLEICGGLVTIDNTKNTVQLAHQTVHEYLTKDSKLLKDADFELAMACTTYLSFDTFDSGACITYDSFKSRLELNPFLDYAAHHVSSHLRQCDQRLSVDIVLRFLKRPGCISSYMQARHNWSDEAHYASRIYDRYPKGRHPLHVACSLGHYAAAQTLIEGELGGELWAPDSEGRTALHDAAEDGNADLVQLLLENGADFLLADIYGGTALHMAALHGYDVVVRLLLEKGASVTAVDREGETALHAGAMGGNKTVVRLLLDKGANYSVGDATGWTPLHTASFSGRDAVVQLLLEEGADVLARDNDGSRAIDLATSRGKVKVVLLLENASYKN